MADAKIINYGQPIGAGSTAIPDNTSEALDIQGTDANEYISIDTIDSNPLISLKAADGSPGKAFEVRADGAVGFNNSNSGWMTYEDTTATNPTVGPRKSDWDTGIGSAAANQLSLVAGGTEAVQLRSGPEVHLGDYANDAGSNALVFKKSRSATTGTAAIVEDNDVLGLIEFQGADSAGTADSNFATGAKIFARVNGTPGDGDMPTELVFETTPDGTETPVARMSLSHNGVIATTTDTASCMTFNRTGSSDALQIRLSSGTELNTGGTQSLRITQSYKEIADFNGETLVLENENFPYSGSSGGLWVDLPNTCSSSGTGNRVIGCTAHGLQAGDAVAFPSGDSSVYEVFKVESRGSSDHFTVDSDLTNSISGATGNTDGNKLVIKSGHGDTRFQVKGSGNTQITSGQRQLELYNEEGLVRWYWDDTSMHGQAGSGSGRIRFETSSGIANYFRYGGLHIGDELTDITTAVFHPIQGADINSDIPTVKVEQLNTTHNPYAIEINNTGSGDSIHDDSGAKLTAAGVWTDASDVMHKEDIVDIPYGLAEVLEMQPRKYKLKKTGEEDIGFISQEMEVIIPEVVFGDDAVMKDKIVDVTARPAKLTDDGEEIDPAREEKARFNVPTGGKSLSYSHLTAVLVKAVQELTARVTQLEAGD